MRDEYRIKVTIYDAKFKIINSRDFPKALDDLDDYANNGVGRQAERRHQLAAQRRNENSLKFDYHVQTANYFERESGKARQFNSWNVDKIKPTHWESIKKLESLKKRRDKLQELLKNEEEAFKREIEDLKSQKKVRQEVTLEALREQLKQKRSEQSLYHSRVYRRIQSYFNYPTQVGRSVLKELSNSSRSKNFRMSLEDTNLRNPLEESTSPQRKSVDFATLADQENFNWRAQQCRNNRSAQHRSNFGGIDDETEQEETQTDLSHTDGTQTALEPHYDSLIMPTEEAQAEPAQEPHENTSNKQDSSIKSILCDDASDARPAPEPVARKSMHRETEGAFETAASAASHAASEHHEHTSARRETQRNSKISTLCDGGMIKKPSTRRASPGSFKRSTICDDGTDTRVAASEYHQKISTRRGPRGPYERSTLFDDGSVIYAPVDDPRAEKKDETDANPVYSVKSNTPEEAEGNIEQSLLINEENHELMHKLKKVQIDETLKNAAGNAAVSAPELLDPMTMYLTYQELHKKIEDLERREQFAVNKHAWEDALRLREMRNCFELFRDKQLYDRNDIDLDPEDKKLALQSIEKRTKLLVDRKGFIINEQFYNEEAGRVWKSWCLEDEKHSMNDGQEKQELLLDQLANDWKMLEDEEKRRISYNFQKQMNASFLQHEMDLMSKVASQKAV